jgi:AcrR family transcriptional regulator
MHVPRPNDLSHENDTLKRLLADAEIEKASLREQITSLAPRPERRSPVGLDTPDSLRTTGQRSTPSSRRSAGAEEVTPLRRLRQRKRERLHQQIEAVALDLFDRKGFDSTTVEEIAAAVDISPRTFFRYFASKEDVLLVTMDEVQSEILEAASGRYDGSAGSLLSALVTFSEGLDQRRSELLRVVRLLGQPSLYPSRLRHSRQLDDALSAVVAHHEDRSEPAAADRALAALAASAMSISMRIWLESGANGPFREVFVSTLGVLSALGGAAGSAAS